MVQVQIKKGESLSVERRRLKSIVEALIFASDHPLSLDRLCNIIEGSERADIKGVIEELVEEYRSPERGLYLEEVAGGYQLRTRPEHAPWIRRLFKLGMQRISRASLEALAIVAYRQPITRAELEEIRGVDSGGVLRTLLEKRLIKIIGRKDVPGRPVVYGTTKEFLEVFDLKDLSGLPSLKEIQGIEGEGIEGDGPCEASEGDSTGRSYLQEEGRGDDTGGEGEGQPQGGSYPGDKG